ncbi:TonB-dependent receptor [Alteromonas sp. BL110]|uniref:TonB-dependent receptor n=1 Tax=Alteromonas sp. BL110 TaxID=1714845 RepID=UPI000E486010|nr:TonB-dependent receptor [Alteromonas sp. BL110]AXT39284.1 TonB-dependent receptor [Alteromonas sp. BL110]RKM82232.1 TonB-dependent receptor [Alteromonas sp. BL110]
MIKKNSLSRIAMAVALSIGVTATAVAATGQSSAMRGTIVGPLGNPAAGTAITIIHQPSGTVKEVTVNEDGAFSARGLRVGGPYMIVVESDKFQGRIIEDVYLELNDTFELDTVLESASSIERVTVTGSRDFFANNGSNSVFGESAISNMPTFNRDIKDIVRSNPLAVVSADGEELSIAGSNPKYNTFTVDGVGVNDTFGLQSNGYPTSRPPVSLDAISQVSVEFTPFTARAGKFGGGNVNVVTKSGTNEFHGTAFYEEVPFSGTAEDTKLYNTDYDIDNEESSYGFTLGGPLIKDKLFFFGSYEKWEEEIDTGFNASAYPSDLVTAAESVITALSETYGLEDSIAGAPDADEDEKFLVKLDWNINNNHRADFTYSYQENTAAQNYNDDADQVLLTSNTWTLAQKNTYYTTHIYSDWTDNLQTEISVSYKEFEQASVTASNWGEINIDTATGTDSGYSVIAGVDENRHANVLANEVWNFAAHATYLAGDVEYKFGGEIENTWNYNLYGRDSLGTWYFDDVEGLANQDISFFEYANAYTNNVDDLAYDVESTVYALYGDATFELFEDFMVTGGLRYEYLTVEDSPQLNDNFANTYGFANTENLDGFDIILPRLSFNWTLNDNLTLRGGVGRFYGGMPLVWISNAYTSDGVTNDSITFSNLDAASVDFTSVPTEAQSALVQGAGSTNSIDPDFELPSDWRYQIAADYTFDIPNVGDNFAWTTELTYVDRKNAAYWEDLSRIDSGNSTVDGRIIWDNVYDGTEYADNYDIQLTNSDDGGRSILFTTALAKQWDNGFSLNASYTHQDITEVNPGTSSTGESNYQYEVTVNRNDPLLGTAYYETKHRLLVNLGYTHQFFEGYNTNINLFFERRSGQPFSWVLGSYQDGGLGDQTAFDDSDIYLPYIPSGANDAAVDFESGLSYDEIMAIAEQAGVAGYAGGYVDKYANTQPWVTTMDLAISQEIPGFVEGHKGRIYLNIDNFANLLNDDWGKVYEMSFPQQILFDYDVNDAGQYVYQEASGGTDTRNYDSFDEEQSTWRIKVGVKYTF